MQRKHHKSTLERIRKVRAIVDRYYEAGNNSKCYKAVWQRYVCPLYPMSYRTFLELSGHTDTAAPATHCTGAVAL